MDNQQNNISSQAKLSAIAGMMFFAPFVKNSLKSESELTEYEKNFILWYVQIWYVNIVFLLILIISKIIEIWIQSEIFTQIENVSSLAMYIVIAFSILTCIAEMNMRWKDESIMQDIQHKWMLFKSFLPIENFILRFRQKDYNMPYRRLKESVFLWINFIIRTLLFWNSAGIWILIIIVVRLVLLLLNIDIIPMSMKKWLNNLFSCNPSEIIAHISAPLIATVKKSDLSTMLQTEKQKYAQWQTLGIWIIIQYVLFLWLLFLLYRNISISVNEVILLSAFILWICRVIIFYYYKRTLPRIPILSEIIWLIFK